MKFMIGNFKKMLFICASISFIAHFAQQPADNSNRVVGHTRAGRPVTQQEADWIRQLKAATQLEPKDVSAQEQERVLSQVPKDKQKFVQFNALGDY